MQPQEDPLGQDNHLEPSKELDNTASAPAPDTCGDTQSGTSTGQKDLEITRLKKSLARRNEELAKIALYLKSIEEDQFLQQRELDRVSRALDDATEENLALQNSLLKLGESKDRLRFSRALTLHENHKTHASSGIDQKLLRNAARTRISEEEIRELATDTRLFDAQWYIKRYSLEGLDSEGALTHYFDHGHRLGHNPSQHFDGQHYIAMNADLDGGGTNPLRHYIQFGVCEGRPVAAVQERMRVRAIMMQRNEVDLIYPWALYHGVRFGFENLHIIDNGSKDSFQPRLDYLQSIGVQISRQHNSREDFVNKGRIISEIIKRYDEEDPADFYFPLDCDEFVGVELQGGLLSFSEVDIFNELNAHYRANEALTVATYFDNHPGLAGSFKRTTGQRKSFFAEGACQLLDRGFSNPKVRGGGGRRKTSIVYMHYHFKPYQLVRLHARQKLEAFLEDFSEETLRQYINERKTGFHSARHLLVGEREYLARDATLFKNVTAFSEAFESLEVPLPFSDGYTA
ncbi:glycosyltransferase family 2 protein [Acidisoma sp. S159]|uniref:glycosyltransferase family 2 protein n=1 Tax=Acidisoma sp. S159 TaxID=1747225 RepID=UPI00131E1302|nr:glycosyltransferase family 2 protein [Acidisoma sp. S159]